MVETRDFQGFDGTRISVSQMGEGPAVLLLHGLFSSAQINWIRYGTAKTIADAGYRVIMPDWRGHGNSDCPTEPEAWPEDVLSMDAEALIDQLGLGSDFVLGGYSLGARTSVRLLHRGLKPRACIFGGMGVSGILGGADRGKWFIRLIERRDTWERGTAEFAAAAFMKSAVKNPDPIKYLMAKQPDTPHSVLTNLTLPTLVVCGEDDQDNGSAPDLAAAIPNAVYDEIPGNHMSAVAKPELGRSILNFLTSL